jgi:hypothetical protein
MALDPSIALGVRPLQLPDPLAQMAQVSQIQAAQRQGEAAQRQNEMAQIQLEQLKQDRLEMQNFQSQLEKSGGNPDLDLLAKTMLKSPKYFEKGFELTQKLKEQKDYQAYLDRQAKLAGATMPTGAPSVMRQPVSAPAAPTQDMLGTGMYGMAPTAPMNALAASAGVSPQPSVNALAAPQSRLDELQARYREVSRFTAPGAKAEADLLKDQIKALQAVHVVPNVGLVSGAGQTIVASGMAPTEIKKLTSERDSLPAGDPRRKVYDQAIADLGAANRNAEARLKFDQNKFAWEKANPTMSIQEDPSGLLAVNTRTGVATPIVYGPTGFQAAPAAAPGASMMRQPPAALPGQRTPAIPGMASVLDQTAAPAAMPMPAEAGVRVAGAPVGTKKEAPAKFNDTDLQLAGLAGSLKEFKDEVGKNLFTGAKFLPSGSDTARMQAKYTALLMGVKDLYTLGALTGPDMSIIESQITNPASWSGKMTTKQGFEEQTKVIEDMLKRSSTNLENTYGRTPKATKKALELLPGGASGGISGATANDPLGLLRGKP